MDVLELYGMVLYGMVSSLGILAEKHGLEGGLNGKGLSVIKG